MNRENLLRLADAIEKHEIPWLGYNQIDWITDDEPDRSGHNCGTTACIAGWATVLVRGPANDDEALALWEDAPDVAKEWLGLDVWQTEVLFGGAPLDGHPTPAQAVRTLRHAAEHGFVDWDAANPESAP